MEIYIHFQFSQNFGLKKKSKYNQMKLLVVQQADGKPDSKLYFWDVELDTVQYFNFQTGRGEQDDYSAPTGGHDDNDTNDEER